MEALPEEDKCLLMEQMDEFAKKYPQYAHLMPVRESIYKLNRLEGLQYSVRMQQLEIGAVENEKITEHLNRQAMRGANTAAEGKVLQSVQERCISADLYRRHLCHGRGNNTAIHRGL